MSFSYEIHMKIKIDYIYVHLRFSHWDLRALCVHLHLLIFYGIIVACWVYAFFLYASHKQTKVIGLIKLFIG